MDIVLNAVKILDSRSEFHGKIRNIHIKNGVIKSISSRKISSGKQVDASGMLLSIGWFDLGAYFSDPGYEHCETLESGRNLAMKSGYTGAALLPNTNPVIQTKNEVSYISSQNNRNLVQLYPIASVSVNAEGKELTEMIDLHHAGAVGFSDGLKPIWHTDILLKSLQYLQKFEGLLINKPEDTMLTSFGSMHEGIVSTYLGMKGMPSIAEEIMIQRDLKLLEYAGGKIHFHNLSTSAGVDLVRKAKKKGLEVTCDVAIHQLAFDDTFLEDYDTNYKVNPPLRSEKDKKALWKGIDDGTIDLIVSSHLPRDEESKNLEFDLADFGMINMQTFLPLLLKHAENFELLIDRFTINPRKVLGIAIPEIKKDANANLTLINTEKEWVFDLESNLSLSKNSPLMGHKLTGKVMATFGNGFHYLDKDLK